MAKGLVGEVVIVNTESGMKPWSYLLKSFVQAAEQDIYPVAFDTPETAAEHIHLLRPRVAAVISTLDVTGRFNAAEHTLPPLLISLIESATPPPIGIVSSARSKILSALMEINPEILFVASTEHFSIPRFTEWIQSLPKPTIPL